MRVLSPEELPERPDPQTGLPRPPHAPWFGEGDPPFEQDSKREHDPALAPSPPPEQGPVLAWYQASRRGARISACIFGTVVAVIVTITRGLDWVTLWWSWIVIGISMASIYKLQLLRRFSAGSDWVANRRHWVRVYDLVTVKAQATGTGIYIKMSDSGGRTMEFQMMAILSSDRLIWDLTYNGILHSIVSGGAESNDLLHKNLKLPYPESTRPSNG